MIALAAAATAAPEPQAQAPAASTVQGAVIDATSDSFSESVVFFLSDNASWLIPLLIALVVAVIVATAVRSASRKRTQQAADDKAARYSLLEAVRLSLTGLSALEISARAHCEVELADSCLTFVRVHAGLSQRLTDAKETVSALQQVNTRKFLTLADQVGNSLARAMVIFTEGDIASAQAYIDDSLRPDVDDRYAQAEWLKIFEAKMRTHSSQADQLRDRLASASKEAAQIAGVDVSAEKASFAQIETRLAAAQGSIKDALETAGEAVQKKDQGIQLPAESEIDQILTTLQEKLSARDSVKDELPAMRASVAGLVTTITKAEEEGAPVEKEKRETKELLALLAEVDRKLASGQSSEARQSLSSVKAKYGLLEPEVARKAKLPAEFGANIEPRIALLLESWKRVSPDMLAEVPEDTREWALIHFYETRRDKQPVLLQGNTLVLPSENDPGISLGSADQGSGTGHVGGIGQSAQPSGGPQVRVLSAGGSPAFADPGGQQTTPASGTFCGQCGAQVSQGQDFCGVCGARTVLN